MANGVRLEDEIQAQVRKNQIVLYKLSKEDKRMDGAENGGRRYNTMKMFEQILERNYDKWLRELAAIDDIEKQDTYYRTVIYPHINYFENRVELRHKKHRHVSLYDEDTADTDDNFFYDKNKLEHIPDVVDFDNGIFELSPDLLHELVTDPALCLIIKGLTDEQRSIIYQNAVLDYSTMRISVIKGTTDRNVRKTKDTALRHVRGQYLPVVMFKYKIQTNGKYRWLFVRGVSTSHWERLFAATIGGEYTDYYDGMAFDFVEITKDFRAWDQRDNDWVANWRDEKRRREELAKKQKVLQMLIESGKILAVDYSYGKGVTADYAQDI